MRIAQVIFAVITCAVGLAQADDASVHVYRPVAAAAGGPPDGTVLVGEDSNFTTQTNRGANDFSFRDTAYTASTSGTANEIIAKIWDQGTAINIKMCIYDSSKNLLECATGSTGVGEVDGLFTLNLAGTTQITASSTYWLTFVADSSAIYWYTDSDSWTMDKDDTGSYASTPDPLCASCTEQSAGTPVIYVTQ